jgi:Zn finger protein HypA/HybF involved in hydrogenase expression
MMALGRTDDAQKETYARGQPLLAGETVTPGKYRCRKCGTEYEVEQDKVVNLPVCLACQNDTWDLT